MIACMPQSRPNPPHEPNSDNIMSLAILPSQPMAYSDAPSLLSPSPAKRPKLSLDTSNVPSIFGKGSTSLRLETLSTTSPTARNTFRNAHRPTHAQRTNCLRAPKPTLKPLTTSLSVQESVAESSETHYDESALSSSSASSASTIDSISSIIPYKVAYSTRSILSNGPVPRARKCFAQSRPMFPAQKKVAFKSPLTEVIYTTKFTLRHSDIESSSSSISTLELSSPGKQVDSPVNCTQTEKIADGTTSTSKAASKSSHAGGKRESSDEEDSDDSGAVTPVAGRRKRHRQWVWTLGPVDSPGEQPSSSDNNIPKRAAEQG